jgi:SAM-dependent methyltransferase
MINLDFYKGEDRYSDGEIEEELLEIVKENKDFTEILANDNRWPILYHLSPERRNLLEWFPFKKTARLLEIGAGCGALTGLFCEKVKEVTVMELSKRRANIIAHRCVDSKNLEIFVGNFADIRVEKTFDYITLIGVLEYTRSFIQSPNPYRDLFKKIRKLLKKKGTLIVAIENKFGLKYWAGAKEDHTGQLFSGLDGYVKNNSVETFGKEEIKGLLLENGFGNIKFYYPYPDYKLPTQIFSDLFLPGLDNALPNAPNFDNDRFRFFNEKLAFLNIIKNNKFDFFSNSFLIFAAKKK